MIRNFFYCFLPSSNFSKLRTYKHLILSIKTWIFYLPEKGDFLEREQSKGVL